MTSRPRAFAAAISSTLVVPQSTVMMTRAARRVCRVQRCHRQAVSLIEPTRDVGFDGHAEPAEREGHDGQAGESVRVEIAEHEDPLATLPGESQPRQQDRGIGQERGIMEAVQRVAEPRRDVRLADDTATREQARPGAPRSRGRRQPAGRTPSASRHPGRSSETGVLPRRQDAMRGCTEDLPTDGVVGLRMPHVAPAERACSGGGHAGGRPTAASRRAAVPRRRSTNRSPR